MLCRDREGSGKKRSAMWIDLVADQAAAARGSVDRKQPGAGRPLDKLIVEPVLRSALHHPCQRQGHREMMLLDLILGAAVVCWQRQPERFKRA